MNVIFAVRFSGEGKIGNRAVPFLFSFSEVAFAQTLECTPLPKRVTTRML